MSYVLEALQKREAEADPDAAVSLARAGALRRRHRLWMGLFAVALVLNVALAGWLLLPAPSAAPPLTAVPEQAVAAEPDAAVAAAAPTAAGPAADVIESAPPPPPTPIRVTLRNLPEPVRARLPGLAFSSHMYGNDADLRAVVANGRRLVEGDRIHDVRIHTITESGVVLEFERYLIEVPVFTDWDAL